MRYLQFCQMIKDCRLHTLVNLAEIDRMIALSFGIEEHDHIQNPERLLSFGAFVNILVILACRLFIEPPKTEEFFYIKKPRKKPSEAMIQLMTQFLLPNVCKTSSPLYEDGQKSREVLLFIEPVYNAYRFQAEQCKQPDRPPSTITMRHFIMMMNNFNLFNDQLTVSDVVQILCIINPVAGPQNECDMNSELTFFDFFEALVQIALKPPPSPTAPPTPLSPLTSQSTKPSTAAQSRSACEAATDPASGIKIAQTPEKHDQTDGKTSTMSPDRSEGTARRKSMIGSKLLKSSGRKSKERLQKMKSDTKSNHSSAHSEIEEPIPPVDDSPNDIVVNQTNDEVQQAVDHTDHAEPPELIVVDEFTAWKTVLHQFLLSNFLPAAQKFELCQRLATGMESRPRTPNERMLIRCSSITEK